MSQKSKQKSKSKPQQDNYLFPPSPHPNPFEHLAQSRDPPDEPEVRSVAFTGHSSPPATRQDRLDKELELVMKQKDKLALELEVFRLRQAIAPEPPQISSAY